MQVNQPRRSAHLAAVKTFTPSTESFFAKAASEDSAAIGRKRKREGGKGSGLG